MTVQYNRTDRMTLIHNNKDTNQQFLRDGMNIIFTKYLRHTQKLPKFHLIRKLFTHNCQEVKRI